MDIETIFPLRYYINLGPEEWRRRSCLNEFWNVDLEVQRFPAVNQKYVKSSRGHFSKGRYALALTQKLILRRAKQLKAPSALIFEDDVVLHPEWKEKVGNLDLPDDWGLFFFGCQHRERPEVVSPGVVRVAAAWDLHAFAVKREWFDKVMSVLTPRGKMSPTRSVEPSDRAIARLMREIPTYAAYPNIAWQQEAASSLERNWTNDNYTSDGVQRRLGNILKSFPTNSATTALPTLRPIHWFPKETNVGMGDRLRGMVGMLVFAEFCGRGLVSYWPTEEACPGTFDEVFSALPGLAVWADKMEWGKCTLGVTDFRFNANLTPTELYAALREQDYLCPTVTQKFFTEKWKEKLRTVSPNEQVRKEVDTLIPLSEGGVPSLRILGLQIRRTDAVGETQELDEELESALDQEWNSGNFDAVVLACDNAESTEQWKERLKEKAIPVIHYEKLWAKDLLRCTSLQEAGLDLFMLARCRKILASILGSFVWMAAEIGNVPLQVVSRASLRTEEKLKNLPTPSLLAKSDPISNPVNSGRPILSLADFKLIESANLLQRYALQPWELRGEWILGERSSDRRAWFNPSVINWKGRRLMAYRTESEPQFKWSRTSLTELDSEDQPIPGKSRLLNLPTRFGDWGAEDPRFFQYSGRLWLSYTDGIGMGLAELSDDGEVVRAGLFPKACPSGTLERREKNWGFFEREGKVFISYLVCPHVVQGADLSRWELDKDVEYTSDWSPPQGIGELHGGSNIVEHDGLLWRGVHSTVRPQGINGMRIYYLWLLAFDPHPPFAVKYFSPRPVLRGEPETIPNEAIVPHHVVFCSSLERVQAGWKLTIGHNDKRILTGILSDRNLLFQRGDELGGGRLSDGGKRRKPEPGCG